MTPPRHRREWSWLEFSKLYPAIPRDVLRPLLTICNAAIRNGLTRPQVADTFTRLSQEHPEELPIDIVLEALRVQIPDP